MARRRSKRRGVTQLTWDDFPRRHDEQGWHCRKCGAVLKGRQRAWCSKECLKATNLLVNWRYIRRCILRRDKYRCQMPFDTGICLKPSYEVDHIIEMADGGSFHDWSNLRTLCGGCHLAKTNAMRAKRAEKKKAEKQANEVLGIMALKHSHKHFKINRNDTGEEIITSVKMPKTPKWNLPNSEVIALLSHLLDGEDDLEYTVITNYSVMEVVAVADWFGIDIDEICISVMPGYPVNVIMGLRSVLDDFKESLKPKPEDLSLELTGASDGQ